MGGWVGCVMAFWEHGVAFLVPVHKRLDSSCLSSRHTWGALSNSQFRVLSKDAHSPPAVKMNSRPGQEVFCTVPTLCSTTSKRLASASTDCFSCWVGGGPLGSELRASVGWLHRYVCLESVLSSSLPPWSKFLVPSRAMHEYGPDEEGQAGYVVIPQEMLDRSKSQSSAFYSMKVLVY